MLMIFSVQQLSHMVCCDDAGIRKPHQHGTAIIYFWRPIRLQFRKSMREQPDIHAQLMSEYPQGLYHDLLGSLRDQFNAYFFLLNLVPDWYYACIFGELALQNSLSYS